MAPGAEGALPALHPFIADLLARMRQAGQRPVSAGSVAAARDLLRAGRAGLGQGPELAEMRDITLPGQAGPIRARLLRPASARGVVVYLHGGGWALGTPEDFETVTRALAQASGATVLVPDYRLAPEHPFPAALQDVSDTIAHALAHLSELTDTPAGVVLVGDSAGGNLAISGALGACDPLLRGQALLYPVCDCDSTRPSYQRFAEGLPLSAADMDWFYRHYVGADPAARRDPRVSPLRRDDLHRLPPTLILSAEADILRDEAEAFACACIAAGVPLRYRRVPGVTHGFIRLNQLFPVAAAVIDEVAGFIRDRLAADVPGQDRRLA